MPAEVPATMHFHAIGWLGGVKAAVPVGNAVPTGAFGVRIRVPLPAAAVVVIVIRPVVGSMTTLDVLVVALGGV